MKIMESIISHEGICKALNYSEPNFLDQPPIITPSDLITQRIFPYYRVPEATEEASSFILMSFRNYRPVNGYYKSGRINIFAVVHKSLVMTDYGFLRYDYMISEIDKALNHTEDMGIGKLNFSGMDEVFINNDYLGNVITYQPYDFN